MAKTDLRPTEPDEGRDPVVMLDGAPITDPVPAVPTYAPQQSDEPVGIWRSGWRATKATFREGLRVKDIKDSPYGMKPAVMFGLIAVVSGYNAAIFGIAGPDIVRDLKINLPGLLALMGFLSFFLIFAQVGMGYLLDRRKRIPFFAGGTMFQGVMSMATSRAGGAAVLGVTRSGDSLAAISADVPSYSLLTDYYPLEKRGKVIAFIANLTRFGLFASPLIVGWLIKRFGWRFPFLTTGAALAILGVVAWLVLREPIRGYMERRALGLSEEDAEEPEPAPSFGEAWRTIWGIRTLRRLFMGTIVGGAGGIAQASLFGFFLLQRYHMDAFARGKLTFVSGLGGVVGGVIAGGIVDQLLRNRPQRVLVFSGIISVIGAGFFMVEVAGPPVSVLYIAGVLFGLLGALLGPARVVIYTQILPANMRTLGLSVFVLSAVPSYILWFMLIPRIVSWGIQGVLFAAGPLLIVGALIDLSAAGLFERDLRNALTSQTATLEYRHAKESGTLKLLICKGVEVEYDGVQVLFGVDFTVEQGEIVALLGSNGAGKSTLLKAISGTHEASGGAIVYDGRDVTHIPPYEVAEMGIVLMPGGKGVFPGLSVRENLVLGTWGMDDDYAKERLAEVEEVFPALVARMDARAGTLSGGEQQMLALAMAFLSKPRLLLIDELSLGLAPAIVQELLQVVHSMRDKGITIVLVEQSVNVALTVAERAVFMEKGEVRFSGKTADLLKRPDILRAVYVKGAAAVGAGGRDRAREREIALDGVREPILRVEGVGMRYGGLRALDDVTFDLFDGEILGIVGPNGAGKTTLFEVISGFVSPTAGRVFLEGTDVTDVPSDKRSRMQLVRRFQDARLYPALTVHETIMIALDRHHRGRSIAATAVQTPRARQSERRLRLRADELIDLLGLGAARDKFVRELSTGMRRIADLAVTMASEPKVLLLDEPSSGIAQAEAESLAPLLRRIRSETGCSMLLIEHDMPLITRTSDELLAMVQGSVVIRGSAEEVLSHPVVVESYLGTSEEAINRSGVLS